MRVERLRESKVGQLVRLEGTDPRDGTYYQHFAFLPHDLPEAEKIVLEGDTWNAVIHAHEALGRLRQACAQLPNPQLLLTPSLSQEAVATSALEGTYAPLAEVMEARLPQFGGASRDVNEILGYESMAQQAFDWISERPITMGMLSDLQGILMRFAKDPPRDPGRIREHQVLIGPKGCRVYEARFIPAPPGDQLVAGMQAWQEWINRDSHVSAVVRLALAHYQFETLHPFGDGNGRVGRMVMVLQLVTLGTLDTPSLTISPWLLARRDEYVDLLLQTSETGDWNPWVTFIATGIAEQSERHIAVAEQLRVWCQAIQGELDKRNWWGVIRRVVDDLIAWPVVSMPFIADRHCVSAPTAKGVVDRLVDIGVLKEITGRKYRKLFAALDVIELVESL